MISEQMLEHCALPMIQSFDRLKNGKLRMATPFLYPNGSQIDLFLWQELSTEDRHTGQLLIAPSFVGDWIISDLGQTTAMLLDQQADPTSTQRRAMLVDDVCEQLGIERRGAELRVTLEKLSPRSLAEHMAHLAQACIRVADLIYTVQERRTSSFQDMLSDLLAQTALDVKRNYRIGDGRGDQIQVDYLVSGGAHGSVLYGLSTTQGRQAAVNKEARSIYVHFTDVRALFPQQPYAFITACDEKVEGLLVGRELKRLQSVSQLFLLPRQARAFHQALAA